ncbi:MAG: response regulator transcription factor [Neomegalonema sp.]|nr:response regulator transcription factor [Neomegalonema sp.]
METPRNAAKAPEGPIRTLIVDDHPLVLEGLRSCLENFARIEIVAVAEDADVTLRAVAEHQPDIVLLDVNLPGINGLDIIEQIVVAAPDAAVIMLTMHDKKEYIDTALARGARGYVLKDTPSNEIVAAIDAVAAGGVYFCSSLAQALGEAEKRRASSPLTTREQGVLLLLSEGLSNKEVARRLDISVRTVETHRKNIKRKTGVSSTAGLTRYAIETGLSS